MDKITYKWQRDIVKAILENINLENNEYMADLPVEHVYMFWRMAETMEMESVNLKRAALSLVRERVPHKLLSAKMVQIVKNGKKRFHEYLLVNSLYYFLGCYLKEKYNNGRVEKLMIKIGREICSLKPKWVVSYRKEIPSFRGVIDYG